MVAVASFYVILPIRVSYFVSRKVLFMVLDWAKILVLKEARFRLIGRKWKVGPQ